jgi:glycosyltransferase involved in cell wall biosynthesis
MRILSLCYEYPPLGGGGAKVVAGLTTELVREGCEVDLITMWYRGLPLFERRGALTVYRVPCIRFDQSYCRMWEMPLYLLLALPLALWLRMRRRYSLNHTHFIFPDGALALLLKVLTGLPCIITAHGSDVPDYNPDRFRLAHRLLAPFWRGIVASAATIACPSESIKQLIQQQYSPARTVIVPNGIDVTRFSPHQPKSRRILVVTRMFERKGVQYLLHALSSFTSDYEVHIVGDGPYLPVLKGHVDTTDIDVTFWGFLDNQSSEIRELYETSSIFVFPSESENFPIVLLEAMAAGLAIVTTSGTGCAEVVGDAAMLVAPRDSDGIGRSLETLVSQPELIEALGTRARRRLEERFSWKNVAEQYQRIYQQFSL